MDSLLAIRNMGISNGKSIKGISNGISNQWIVCCCVLVVSNTGIGKGKLNQWIVCCCVLVFRNTEKSKGN